MKRLIMTMFWLLTVATPAYAQSPSDVDYVNTANNLIESREYQKAIQYLNEAIKINPYGKYSYYSYYLLALAYQGLNLHQNAIVNFNYAIRLNASPEPIPYCMRAFSYFNLNEYEKSKLDYVKCSEIALQNQNAEVYGLAQKLLKDTQEIVDLIKPKPQPVVTKPQKKAPVVDAKTRNQLISRACSLSKKGLTDGEILNEVYRLVQMNANPEYREAYRSSYGSSAASQISSMVNRFVNDMNSTAKEEEARNIFASAKKKCKF